MSSKMRLNKICQYCGKEFEARKTTSKSCSDQCAKMLYKSRQRSEKIEATKAETLAIKSEVLKAKEFLTVRDVATLLNCSVRTVYYYIGNGNIKAVNLGQRFTRVKRSDIDKLFT